MISGICVLKNVIEPLSISRTLVLRCFFVVFMLWICETKDIHPHINQLNALVMKHLIISLLAFLSSACHSGT